MKIDLIINQLQKFVETEKDADEMDFKLADEIKDELDKLMQKIIYNLTNYYALQDYVNIIEPVFINLKDLTKIYNDKYLPNIIKLQDLVESEPDYEETKKDCEEYIEQAISDMQIILDNFKKLAQKY